MKAIVGELAWALRQVDPGTESLDQRVINECSTIVLTYELT